MAQTGRGDLYDERSEFNKDAFPMRRTALTRSRPLAALGSLAAAFKLIARTAAEADWPASPPHHVPQRPSPCARIRKHRRAQACAFRLRHCCRKRSLLSPNGSRPMPPKARNRVGNIGKPSGRGIWRMSAGDAQSYGSHVSQVTPGIEFKAAPIVSETAR